MDDEVRLQPDPDDPGLADTVADLDAIAEDDTMGDQIVFERPPEPAPPQSPFVPIGEHEIAGLDLIDPEWGQYDVSRRITSIRKAVETSFAQMLVAGVMALAALAIALLAATWQTNELIGLAAVTCPPTFYFTYKRWRRWLAHRRFMFRLLETLGEDTTGIDPRTRRQRKAEQLGIREHAGR